MSTPTIRAVECGWCGRQWRVDPRLTYQLTITAFAGLCVSHRLVEVPELDPVSMVGV